MEEKDMKKILSIGLAALMAVSMTACGTQKADNGADTAA